jgi:hypothetical protein
MFEKLAKYCCNYSNKTCIGAFFKFDSGQLKHWIDPKVQDKPCLVINKKYCGWFDKVVLPGIPNNSRDKPLLKAIEKWEELAVKQHKDQKKMASIGRYRRICKRCGDRFVTDSPSKRYCDSCRDARRATNLREAARRYRLSKKTRHHTNALVSD